MKNLKTMKNIRIDTNQLLYFTQDRITQHRIHNNYIIGNEIHLKKPLSVFYKTEQ